MVNFEILKLIGVYEKLQFNKIYLFFKIMLTKKVIKNTIFGTINTFKMKSFHNEKEQKLDAIH